jgi:hypothetical protein
MEERACRPPWLQAVEVLPIAFGLAFFMCFAVTTAICVQSPFPLGPFDFGFLQHVRRVLHHSTVYPAPMFRFVALQYTPLYYYVSAAAARVFGEGFLPLRLVSLVSTLWSMAVIGALVWRETRDRRSSVVAACLFAATYRAARICSTRANLTSAWHSARASSTPSATRRVSRQ